MKTTFALTTAIILFIVLASQVSLGEMENDDEGERHLWQQQPEVAVVNNNLYQNECGSCHFAYQPGLLPERSWQKIMSNLANHFGDNAELGALDRQAITQYLTHNSADKSPNRRSRNIMNSITASQTPRRITEIPYIAGKHDEIPAQLVNKNAKVASLSQCDSCHQTAAKGSFSENHISIPGYGKWDD